MAGQRRVVAAEAVAEEAVLRERLLQAAGDLHRRAGVTRHRRGGHGHRVRHGGGRRRHHGGGGGVADHLVRRLVGDHHVERVDEAGPQPAGEHRGAGGVVVADVGGSGAVHVQRAGLAHRRQPHPRQVVDLDLQARPLAAGRGLDALPDPPVLPRRGRGAVARDVPHDAVEPVHGGQAHPCARREAAHGEQRGILVLDMLAERRQRAGVVARVERRHELVAEHEPGRVPHDRRAADQAAGDRERHHRRHRGHPARAQRAGPPRGPAEHGQAERHSAGHRRDRGPGAQQHRQRQGRHRHDGRHGRDGGTRAQRQGDRGRGSGQGQQERHDEEVGGGAERWLQRQHLLPRGRGARHERRDGVEGGQDPGDRRRGGRERPAADQVREDEPGHDGDRRPAAQRAEHGHAGAEHQAAGDGEGGGRRAVHRDHGDEGGREGRDEHDHVDHGPPAGAGSHGAHPSALRSTRGRSSSLPSTPRVSDPWVRTSTSAPSAQVSTTVRVPTGT